MHSSKWRLGIPLDAFEELLVMTAGRILGSSIADTPIDSDKIMQGAGSNRLRLAIVKFGFVTLNGARLKR